MRDYFQGLQVVRAVACLVVVFAHVTKLEYLFGLNYLPIKPIMLVGPSGVDAFFVLSGFIIGSTTRSDLGRPGRLHGYLFRRFWRIYPVFWVALAIGVGAQVAFRPEPLFVPGWVESLLGTAALLPDSPFLAAIPVAWTLPSEVAFYLAFGLLFLAPRRAAVPLLVGWGAVTLAFAAVGQKPGNRFAALWVSPFVLEFLAGCFIARWPVQLSGRRAVALGLVAAAWLGVGLGLKLAIDPAWDIRDHRLRVLTFGPGFALGVLALIGWERGGGQVGLRWLQRVGDASYSIFLTHLACLYAAFWGFFAVNWSHSKSGHAAWVVLMFAAGVLPGMLFYRYVERPLLGLAKRKRKAGVAADPRPVPAPVPARLAA
jgi:peptidoglycan/LPS O-acetylase OafA/YrhL